MALARKIVTTVIDDDEVDLEIRRLFEAQFDREDYLEAVCDSINARRRTW